MGDDATLPRPAAPDAWRSRRRFSVALVRVVALAGALAASTAVVLRRVEVAGDSMLPAIAPGDRLVVLRHPRWPWRIGQLAALHDPRRPGDATLLVKRVTAVSDDGVEVRGDNEAASTDSRTFGPVSRSDLVGPVLYRYWPAERAGRLPARGAARSAGTLGS